MLSQLKLLWFIHTVSLSFTHLTSNSAGQQLLLEAKQNQIIDAL